MGEKSGGVLPVERLWWVEVERTGKGNSEK
jgi:hypothetical protein